MVARRVTVVVVDDHEVVADGIRAWCTAATPPVDVVDAGVRAAVAWTGAGAHADVVVLDLQLEYDRPDFTAVRDLCAAGRHVVIYTQVHDDRTARRCIKLGALAYVTKSEGKAHLVSAVRLAAQGLTYTPPSLSGALVADDDKDRPVLAPMEIDALRAWFSSSSKTMAAESLGISPKTLDTYITRVRNKYARVGRETGTQARLMAHTLADGVIDLDDVVEPHRLSG